MYCSKEKNPHAKPCSTFSPCLSGPIAIEIEEKADRTSGLTRHWRHNARSRRHEVIDNDVPGLLCQAAPAAEKQSTEVKRGCAPQPVSHIHRRRLRSFCFRTPTFDDSNTAAMTKRTKKVGITGKYGTR